VHHIVAIECLCVRVRSFDKMNNYLRRLCERGSVCAHAYIRESTSDNIGTENIVILYVRIEDVVKRRKKSMGKIC